MKEERREMQETVRNAQPRQVGGVLRRIIGAREAEERMNRMKFKNETRTIGKEHELLLSLVEEAITTSLEQR